MPIVVFGSVLLAAFLHAAWNGIVKGGGDKLLSTILVATAAALIAAVVLPFLDQPARASWPFIGASVLVHAVYFGLVAAAYRLADMGLAYPLMRGTAPLLVALFSAFIIGEALSHAAWIGVLLISFGILAMVTEGRRSNGRGLAVALGNAFVIGGYTLIDGHGARLSGAPIGYVAWVFLLTGIILGVWVCVQHRGPFLAFVAHRWRLGLLGGTATLISYGLVLWAMTLAPVAIVAALRETSILFATVIAGVVLRERVSGVRIAGACVIALGAAALRLA